MFLFALYSRETDNDLDKIGLTQPIIHLLCAFVYRVSSLGTVCAGGLAVAVTMLVLPHSEYAFQMRQLVS